jgi:hypothetical protein
MNNLHTKFYTLSATRVDNCHSDTEGSLKEGKIDGPEFLENPQQFQKKHEYSFLTFFFFAYRGFELKFARQVLYSWSHAPALKVCSWFK